MPLGETPSSRSVDWYVLARFAWRGLGGPTLVIPPCNSRGVVVRIGSILFVGVILRMWDVRPPLYGMPSGTSGVSNLIQTPRGQRT